SIIGPNGGGKARLFHCVSGVPRPKRGRIMFDGRSLVGLRPHVVVSRGIGRTFQGIRLFKNMAVFENVMVGLYPRHRTMTWQAMLHTPGERKDELRTLQESRRWLSFVGLESLAGRLATELSYADQRRVEIARALAAHPHLALFDAPAPGMNPTENPMATSKNTKRCPWWLNPCRTPRATKATEPARRRRSGRSPGFCVRAADSTPATARALAASPRT